MKKISVKTTKPEEIVDITPKIQKLVEGAGVKDGICHIFVAHTTCALTTADLDPGTDQDMLDAFREMIPKLKYRHPHNPSHVGDHIMSSIISPSVSVPIENGNLTLGTWQRIVLVELNGPKNREITATFK
jgi:secondary thiamine-phosphate synthase enzyme